jgi:uncharacterized membrane protein YkvA (DUF1232 family)
MAATASMRWGAFRSIASALRALTRSGGPGLGERLGALPRLARATLRGEYAGTSRGRLALLLAAVVYVISPLDFMPEMFFSVFGLADDAVVVSWIAATVVNETERYLTWEKARDNLVPGEVVG